MKQDMFFFLLILLSYSEAYKILVSYPLPIKSLGILGQGIVRHLVNSGHEVTYITNYPIDIPESKNFRQIYISGNKLCDSDDFSIANILDNKMQQNDFRAMQEFAREGAIIFFENENVTNFLAKPEENFDAVVSDLFETEIYTGLSALYNCPMLWEYSMGAHWQVLRLISDTGSPAYDADYLGTNVPPFTFMQRVEELVSRIKWSLYKTFVTKPKERELYERTFKPLFAKRGRELPDYEEIIYNASMIFGNEHNAVIARPNTPQNFKYIGGFHINEPIVPLPKNLQDLMDNAPNGVIYFSMGTFWKSKMMPPKLIRGLLDMFGELKETVIWKYEDNLKELPKNVHILRWAPQQSILAHHNCKFFISHGGLLSAIESVHFGVPIIGIPVMFDQYINVNKAVYNGYAVKVDLSHDLPQNLKAGVNLMLSDETYRQRAKELSFIYHDRPTKPGAELVHWIQHVIRTRGALHLRSPAFNTPLYQQLYLDLIALIIGIFFILYYILRKLLKKGNENEVIKKNN